MHMTPNHIEILIHCHVSPISHPRAKMPAVADALRDHHANGLIAWDPTEDCYRTTERGRMHVGQLCALPLPKQAWIGYDGKIMQGDGGRKVAGQ